MVSVGAVTLGLDSSPIVAIVKNNPKTKINNIIKSNYNSHSLLTYFKLVFSRLV